ncbi:hypothetical protein EGW08_023268 [Elysia chlorotica]|uniref:Omega-crystallin n=1 Tax=Elysia chlorotica TaxID=188477 RepID=A0A3S1GZ11_ELYCH|nr:hypothetical protein EGW08_023268 [Elysia chlorotica]
MASQDRPPVEIKYKQLFIDNKFVDSINGKTIPVINPTNEELICEVQAAEKEDVDVAVKAARRAFEIGSSWRRMDASKRGKLLEKFAQLLEKNKEYVASLDCLDNGKPYFDAEEDVAAVVDLFRYYAGWCDKICGKTIPVDGNYFTYTVHEPVGVCGQIIPLGPALACGNTVVLKPSEVTPLSALFCAQLFKETGRKVMCAAAQSNLKRVTLELGGKSPLIVFSDCDLDFAVTVAHGAIMNNHGQNCCAGSRTFVEDKIYDQFVEKSRELVASRSVGDPFDPLTQQGPLVNKAQFDKVLGFVEQGKAQGAKLIYGGERVGDKGFFIKPTVFCDVTDDMSIATDEIFGPVQSILHIIHLLRIFSKCQCSDIRPSPEHTAHHTFTTDIF